MFSAAEPPLRRGGLQRDRGPQRRSRRVRPPERPAEPPLRGRGRWPSPAAGAPGCTRTPGLVQLARTDNTSDMQRAPCRPASAALNAVAATSVGCGCYCRRPSAAPTGGRVPALLPLRGHRRQQCRSRRLLLPEQRAELRRRIAAANSRLFARIVPRRQATSAVCLPAERCLKAFCTEHRFVKM
jgi:hypothetical protein